jgi:hypothetical protein
MNADASAKSARGPALLALVWLGGVLYAAMLMSPSIGAHIKFGLTFNEMLSNLLQGRFDIDPAIIRGEAFEHDGRSYAYFGVFCALLRLPLLLTGKIGVDMTAASQLIAAAVSLACRLAIATTILNRAKGAPLNPLLRAAVLVGIATNGESVQYLHPSIYQEVIAWGDALAALFVLFAARRILGFSERRAWTYAAMATVAGLALMCRVSFGLGLYGALAYMLAAEALTAQPVRRRIAGIVRTLAPAAAILAVFAVLAGGVNYARWGNPLTFVPLRYQAIAHRLYPDRAPRLQRYGEVNLRRVPFSLQYYFAPIWAVTDNKGDFILQRPQVDLFEDVELPPSSFLLSDPVTCILAALGLMALSLRPQTLVNPALARAAQLGLALPACLMLTAISLTFRYRMEFYPALDFAAWLGLAALANRTSPLPGVATSVLGSMSLAGMAVAAVSLLIYAIVPLGPATDLNTPHGWTGLIADRLAGREVHRGHLMPDGRRIPLDGI